VNNLYDILDICLREMEHGVDVEKILARYPELAKELRPILLASAKAKQLAVPGPLVDVARRNRAKLLQHAAEMREGKVKRKSYDVWFPSLRRLAVTLIVLIVVFAGGTSLVRASSGTVPGDRLYPVKRTWENVLVFFTTDSQKREFLEFEQGNERLEELHELFEQGRSAPVDFVGVIASQSANQWLISGINVLISPQTKLVQEPILIGAEVHVIGRAQTEFVQADSIELISLNEVLSTPENSSMSDHEKNLTPTPSSTSDPNIISEGETTASNSNQQLKATESTSNQELEATLIVKPVETVKPSVSLPKSFKGIVQSMNGNVWIINGVQVNVRNAEISGSSAIGVMAKVEGYFDQAGIFIAKRIELPEDNSSVDSGGVSEASPTPTPRSHYDDHEGDDEHDHITETPEPQH